MHTETIHQAFEKLITKRGIHHSLHTNSINVRFMRWMIRHNKNITIDTKLKLLQRAGYRLEQFQYTDADMLSVIKFTLNTSEQARKFGPGYVLEKWKMMVEPMAQVDLFKQEADN